jgi:phosphatidylserine decarboxylase
VAVCPADARSHCFPTIQQSTDLWIKGSKFSIESLLGQEDLAIPFRQGSLAIFRLAPQDYHRFHFPVDGTITYNATMEGTYFTVNPMAVRTTVDVFTENARTVTILESPQYGKVAYVCIGAMMVGSIVLTSQTGQTVQRMEEHGYFKFGGSTIVLLFEKDRILFDTDLVENSKTCLETLVRVGNSLGCVPRQ